MKYIKNRHIPRGYTQAISKKPFFRIKALELQKFVVRRKGLTLIYICHMIFFPKENINPKLNKNNDNLLFLKFQHKITGYLCGLGKNLSKYRIKDTIPLQNMLKILNVFGKQ